jgi:hypothetical protein
MHPVDHIESFTYYAAPAHFCNVEPLNLVSKLGFNYIRRLRIII